MNPSGLPLHASILASAGSGKTYRLSSRYLALLAAGARPGAILATTFTRVAAGEIRDRILRRLAMACVSRVERERLAASLHDEVGGGLDRDLSAARLSGLLAGITRDLHHLQVRTIDSFFAGIVRCFALQLDLPANAAIVDGERERVLTRDAIRLMLAEGDSRRLIDLLREFIEGRADRGVTEEIERTVAGLHGLFREAPHDAWDTIEHTPVLDDESLRRAIAALERAGEAAAWPDKRHRTAMEKNLAQLKDRAAALASDWADFLDGGLARPIALAGAVYYGKPIDHALVRAYRPLVEHARAVVRNAIRTRTLATRDLLERYDAAALQARRAASAITFADLTAAVAGRAGGQEAMDLDDVYFRLDARVQHLLLDEMQDTSVEQWRALMPIAREVLATHDGSRTFFCVGDVKQSIYGWRDAAPDLLERLPDLFPSIQRSTLSQSWRSSPVVIDVVNRVFGGITGNPVMSEFRDAARAWDKGFREHEAVEKNRRLPGHVELRVCRSLEEGEHPATVRLREAATLVRVLHRQAPAASIGVLTRSNKAVGRLLNELSLLDVRATGRGGGPLTDASPVNAVLDALRVAEHPDHTIACFHVVSSPLWAVLGGARQRARRGAKEWARDQKADVGGQESERAADGRTPTTAPAYDTRCSALPSAARVASLSRHIRRLVLEHGLACTIARWVRDLAPSCDARELRRLHDLVELAASHDAQPTPRLDDFIRLVETTAVADPVEARIEVMTIHKSKGLEFDVVVLPDLDGQLIRTENALVAVDRPEPGGRVARITRWVSQKQWAHFDDLRALHEAAHQRLARESLAVLYVAMTRAVSGLYMLIDGPINRAPKCSHAALLLGALASGRDRSPGAVLFASGDPSFLDHIPHGTNRNGKQPDASPADILGAAEPVIPLRPPARGALAAASPSAGTESPTAEPFRLPDAEALDIGTAMHALFEQIEWIEQGVPDDAVLLQGVRRALPRRDSAWTAQRIAAFRASLERPPIRAVLAQSRGEEPTLARRVWRERRFVRESEGAIQQGSIDRLEATYDRAGHCLTARVIDFKTDAVEPGEGATHAVRYRRQMLDYRAAASEMLGIEPARVDLLLVFVVSGEVIPVDGVAVPDAPA